VRVCIRHAVTLTESGPEFDLEQCFSCGHCQAVCPVGLIDHAKAPRQESVGEIPSYEDAARFLRTARSVRLYKDELIPRDKLLKLVDVARYAQTGSNTQGISYLILSGKEKVKGLLELFCDEALDPVNGNDWLRRCAEEYRSTGCDGVFRGCTSLIIALSDADFENGAKNAQFCLTFAALAAPSLGVGTCWAGIFERLAAGDKCPASIRDYLKLPAEKRIRGVLMAGVPDVTYRRLVGRNPLDVTFLD